MALFVVLRRPIVAILLLIAATGTAQAASSIDDLRQCAGDGSSKSDVKVCAASGCETFEVTNVEGNNGAWLNYLPRAFLDVMTGDGADTYWIDDPAIALTVEGTVCTIPVRIVYQSTYFREKSTGAFTKYVDARCALFGVDALSDVYDNNVTSAAFLQWTAGPSGAFSYQYSDCPYLADHIARGKVPSSVEGGPAGTTVDAVSKVLDARSDSDVDHELYEPVGRSIETFEPFALVVQR